MTDPIKVWSFHQAPEEYQALSEHGGDEDWVALIPKKHWEKYGEPGWAASGSRFGCCDTSLHELNNGDVILIGAHA
jgi:hypothetical protein